MTGEQVVGTSHSFLIPLPFGLLMVAQHLKKTSIFVTLDVRITMACAYDIFYRNPEFVRGADFCVHGE